MEPIRSMEGAPEHFDILVLGSGEAGKYLSWALGIEGKRVALIERRYVGGSCPNIACLPSKNLIHSAKVVNYARKLEDFGLPAQLAPVDMSVVRDRKRKMVSELVKVHEGRFAASHVEFIYGEGVFTGPREISLQTPGGYTRLLGGDTVIVSTGSRASLPQIAGLADAVPMTHVEQLELDVLPEHLVILGAGYVGLEFAQAMARLGSKVTVVGRSARLLPQEDDDVSTLLQQLLSADGVNFVLSTKVSSVEGKSGISVRLALESEQGTSHIEATHLLVATGRTPNTDGLGLERTGVELTATGHVKVDASLRTTVEGIYAVGDCAGSPLYTHIAFDDYRVVLSSIRGGERVTTGRQVPYTLFTDPELAHVGMHEYEAKHQEAPYRLAKLPMAAVLRTRTMGETAGFLKAMIGEDDRILGFTALGTGAGELLAPVQLAMAAGLPYTSLRDLIVTHPTLTEGLVYLFSSVLQKSA